MCSWSIASPIGSKPAGGRGGARLRCDSDALARDAYISRVISRVASRRSRLSRSRATLGVSMSRTGGGAPAPAPSPSPSPDSASAAAMAEARS